MCPSHRYDAGRQVRLRLLRHYADAKRLLAGELLVRPAESPLPPVEAAAATAECVQRSKA